MPEGDTIWRAASSLRRWIGGRVLTRVYSPRFGTDIAVLVGQRIDAIQPTGKHLFISTSAGWVLHTHMRMKGSWHCYETASPWRRSRSRAGIVLETSNRCAVCFDAPVIELIPPHTGGQLSILQHLGPDILHEPFDWAKFDLRWNGQAQDRPIGEALLDQAILSGIGNIYRCETLFLMGISPFVSVSSLSRDVIVSIVNMAARTMQANLTPAQGFGRDFGAGIDGRWVYRRAGRACLRCGSIVRSSPLGDPVRTVYWCPGCQMQAFGRGENRSEGERQ